MNKKGQALVEFIIILPIMIMILLAAFDLVNIFSTKISLEHTLEDVILDDSLKLEKDIKLTKEASDGLINYKLSKTIDMSSPFVTMVIDEYVVTVERTVYE